MSLDIAHRLRDARQRNGLSQRSLAKRSGISNATISLIESRKLNPSVAVLKRILDGISMDLADFFATAIPEPEPVVYRADELVEIARGKISYMQVGSNLADRSMQILHELYAPGADTGKVALSHSGEEGGVIVRGHIELTVDEERQLLGPGDAYYFESSRPHRFRNLGRDTCEIVSACSPTERLRAIRPYTIVDGRSRIVEDRVAAPHMGKRSRHRKAAVSQGESS